MAYLQDKFGSTGATNTIAITLTGVTAGSTLVFFVDIQDPAVSATITVSDSVNGALAQTSNGYFTAASRVMAIFTIANVSAGSHTVTGTLGASATLSKDAFLVECSAPVSSVIDGTPTFVFTTPVSTATDAIAANPVTTTVDGSTILSFCVDSLGATFVPGTGYTNSKTGISTANGDSVNVEHQTQNAAGSVTATWTDKINGGGDSYAVWEIAIKAPQTLMGQAWT